MEEAMQDKLAHLEETKPQVLSFSKTKVITPGSRAASATPRRTPARLGL